MQLGGPLLLVTPQPASYILKSSIIPMDAMVRLIHTSLDLESGEIVMTHYPHRITPSPTRANKTDAGNGSKAICRVSNVLRSPSPDPKRSPN